MWKLFDTLVILGWLWPYSLWLWLACVTLVIYLIYLSKERA